MVRAGLSARECAHACVRARMHACVRAWGVTLNVSGFAGGAAACFLIYLFVVAFGYACGGGCTSAAFPTLVRWRLRAGAAEERDERALRLAREGLALPCGDALGRREAGGK